MTLLDDVKDCIVGVLSILAFVYLLTFLISMILTASTASIYCNKQNTRFQYIVPAKQLSCYLSEVPK